MKGAFRAFAHVSVLTMSLVCISGLLHAQVLESPPVDTIEYREGVEKQRFEYDRIWVDRIKAKSVDSLLIWLHKDDLLLLQASAKRALSISIQNPDGSTLYTSTLGSRTQLNEFELSQTGMHTVKLANPAFLFASKVDVRLTRIHQEEVCTQFCAEYTHQRRSEPLPKRIETTVSSKIPQSFTKSLRVKDTLSIFFPGSRKIPRVEVWAPKGQRMFTLESGRAPLELKLAVTDTGAHTIMLSKSGLLGRLPTTHELYIGQIRPAIANDSCCTRYEYVPRKPFKQRIDTLLVVRKDSTIELGARRNIKKTSDFVLKIPAYPQDSLISRVMMVAPFDSTLQWDRFSAVIQSKEMANLDKSRRIFSLLKEEYGNPSSKMRIYMEATDEGEAQMIQSVQLIPLEPDSAHQFRFSHQDPIQDTPFRYLILEFHPVEIIAY